MPEFEIKPELEKKLVKLSKKDKIGYEAVMNKIKEDDPFRAKKPQPDKK